MLAIAGGKGGCGKTTTAFGLGVALARTGSTPLLVDGDCDMPDLHHLAGVDRVHRCGPAGPAAGVDALGNGVGLQRAVRWLDDQPGLALLTGGKRENRSHALHAARQWDGPVVVDCPAGATPVATSPLRHAERTVLVTTDRVQCVEDAQRTASAARQLGATVQGFVVRGTHDGTVDPGLLEERILETVPTVEEPPLGAVELQRRLENLASGLSTVGNASRKRKSNND